MYYLAVVVLIPYFLFASYKSRNTQYHPSAFWYSKVPIFIEFSIICIVSFCAYYLKYCQHSYYVIPIIIVLLGIAFILALDLTFIVFESLCLDLWAWLRLDIHNHVVPDDSYHAAYYAPFAKEIAYQRYRFHAEVIDCPICLDPFEEEPYSKRVLLQCGHLFHQDCIDKWEQEQWTNGRCIRPFSRCPCCREWYHSDVEKFEYDKDYKHPQFLQYPGRVWLQESLWNKEVSRYIDHAKSVYRSCS